MIKNSLEKSIINTKIIKLKSIKNSNIYIKLEYFNLGGSVKSIVAYSMLQEVQKNISIGFSVLFSYKARKISEYTKAITKKYYEQ